MLYFAQTFKLSKSFLITAMILFLSFQSAFGQTAPKSLFHQSHDHSKCSRHTQCQKEYGKSDVPQGKIAIATASQNDKSESESAFKSNNDDCPTPDVDLWLAAPSVVAAEFASSEYTGTICLEDYLEFDDGVTDGIFNDINTFFIASSIDVNVNSYDGTNDDGFFGYFSFLHAAVYHNFFSDQVNLYEVDDDYASTDTHGMIRDAVTSFSQEVVNDGHLSDLGLENLDVISRALIVAGEEGIRDQDEVHALVENIMQMILDENWAANVATDFWNDPNSENDETFIRDFVNAYNQIFFIIYRGGNDDEYLNSLEGINTINLLCQLAIDPDLIAASQVQGAEDLEFLWLNAVGALTNLTAGEDPEVNAMILTCLEEIISDHAEGSLAWAKATLALNTYYPCEDIPEGLYNHPYDLKQDLLNVMFTRSDEFDDGKIKIRSSLPDDEVLALYHAAKQVEAQLFRLRGSDTPVEGDQNESLQIYIYDSKDDYDSFGGLLFGTYAGNGGVYIEAEGSFYTWDRTVGVESQLSLESLFRHEYCHYLQGRYLVPGLWGRPGIYGDDADGDDSTTEITENGNRLVWFEEGMANFFAGSTDVDGVKLLQQTANAVINAEYPTPNLGDIFDSGYSGNSYEYYTYGNCLWNYWYNFDLGKFKQFFDLVENVDAEGFDALTAEIVASSATSSNFSSYLNDIKNETLASDLQPWQPETDWAYDEDVALGSVVDLKSAITECTGCDASVSTALSNAGYVQQYTESYARFRIDGSISTSLISNNPSDASRAMSAELDALLADIRTELALVTNLKYAVAHFTDLVINSSTSATAQYVITGPLRDDVFGNDLQAGFSASAINVVVGSVVDFQNESAGLVSELSWDFDNGKSSDEANPSSEFLTAGTYTVALTATQLDLLTGTFVEADIATQTITVHEAPSTACTLVPNDGEDGALVERFSFADVVHESEWEQYSMISNPVIIVEPGMDYTLDVLYAAYNLAVWIDFNGDGTFVNELVASQEGFGKEFVETIHIPNGTIPGVYVMRIQVTSNTENLPDPCFGELNGEIEDYVLVVKDTSIPEVNTAPSVEIIKPGDDPVFVNGEQIEVEFISEDDHGVVEASMQVTSISIPSDAEPVNMTFNDLDEPYQFVSIHALNTLAAGIYQVTITVTDAHGLTDNESFILTITENPETYCPASSSLDEHDDLGIIQVSYAGINNFTEISPEGYTMYTDAVAAVDIGVEKTMILDLKKNNWYGNTIGVWVDWNNDGDLTDKEDLVYRTKGASNDQAIETIPYEISITPPALAVTGVNLRMRVRRGYTFLTNMTSCGYGGTGETEDYLVKVSTPTPTTCVTDLDFSASNTDNDFTVDFTANSVVPIYNWTVNGQSIPGTSPSVSYTFPALGTYEVCLNISTIFPVCSESKCHTVRLKECKTTWGGVRPRPRPIIGTISSINLGGSTSLSGAVVVDGKGSGSYATFGSTTISSTYGTLTASDFSGTLNDPWQELEPVAVGCVKTTVIAKARLIAEGSEVQMTISPNPCIDEFRLNLEIPEQADLTIDVYDMAGSKVMSVANSQTFAAGQNTLNVQRGNLHSGMYIVQLKGAGFLQSEKLMIH